MITKNFNDKMKHINPLLVYRLLQKQILSTNTSRKTKQIVDRNMNECFVAASDFQWENQSVSKKSVFLTNALQPVVIDSGASFCLTHCKEDFISPIKQSNIKSLKTVKDSISVEGEGQVQWIARDINGNKINIQIHALYVPQGHIRFFSPQIWLDTS